MLPLKPRKYAFTQPSPFLSVPKGCLVTRRILIGVGILLLGITVLLSRIAYLQIKDYPKYTSLSKRNQLRLMPIAPPRGLIFDRNGKVLAHNIPALHLVVIPEQVPDLTQALTALEELISLTPEQKQRFFEKVKKHAPYQQQNLKSQLSEEEISKFAMHQHRFPGFFLVDELIREYPYRAALGHVLGYVSEASPEERMRLPRHPLLPIGKTGLEKKYDSFLQGLSGYRQIETDVFGREVRLFAQVPPTAGHDLHLTLDARLQLAAVQAIGNARGAVVVLDPSNGEILALVSQPSFDPNLFVQGIDTASYHHLQRAPDRPLFHRAIQGQYPPASTIKPLLGLAGLATQTITPETPIFDPGWYQINGTGRQFRGWKRHGHGKTQLQKAIRESCDVYYYQLAEAMGIQQLADWLAFGGLGKATGIDLPGEHAGLVPTPLWKKRQQGNPWYPGETLNTGIGQGYLTATPLQLAVLGSYIANRGISWRPHLNKESAPVSLPPIPLDQPDHWKTIINAMHQVTAHPQGTAYKHFRNCAIPVAGKTGTAQVVSIKDHETYRAEALPSHLRDHSLFIGFAPIDCPKIVIAVVLENQSQSTQVARHIIESYFQE